MSKAERTPSLAAAREEAEALRDALESVSVRAAAAAHQLQTLLDEETQAIAATSEVKCGWVTVKDAEFRLGRSRKVVWTTAQRTPGASWKDSSGRCYVNLDKLQFGPPKR